MRVLVVPKWYPWPDRPVFGVFCREQARAVARAHDVVVLASDAVTRPGFAVFELTDSVEDGLRTLRLRYRRPRFRPAAMACQLIGMLVALRRLHRLGWSPDVVHAHVYSAGLPALILGRVRRVPVVISEHYTGFLRGLITGYDRLTARLAFRHADLVAPVSHDLAGHLHALEPRSEIRVVENVVDAEAFHPPSEPSNAPAGGRLICVAALTEKKGHRDLLDALAALREQGHELTLDLVGDGELGPELRAQVEVLGLSEAVRFHGELAKARVADLMRQADLFVLPSRFENLPVVLIEAMATGLPAVATSVGGVPELSDTGGEALELCPAGNPSALATAIVRELELRPGIDQAALADRARSRFGYEAIGELWTTIYQELRSGDRRL